MSTEVKTERKRAPKPNTIPVDAATVQLQPAAAKTSRRITFTVEDELGRTLTWEAPTLRQTAAIHAVMPPEYVNSPVSMEIVILSACVRAIDGFPEVFPTTWAKVEARMGAVADEGYIAIREHIATLNDGEAQSEEEVIEAAKK